MSAYGQHHNNASLVGRPIVTIECLLKGDTIHFLAGFGWSVLA